jgi:carbohydrate diacid regulator
MAVLASEILTRQSGQSEARSASDLLASFLRGPSWARAELASSASSLLRDDAELLAVLTIDGRDFVDPPDDPSPVARQRRRIDALVGAVAERFVGADGSIVADMGEGEVVVLLRPAGESTDLAPVKRTAAALSRHLATELRTSIPIGVGLPHNGLSGLVRSYQDARGALNSGCVDGDGLYCLDRAGLAGLVDGASRATRRALAARILAPLEGDRYLSATLDAYFLSDCSPGAAAERLGLHRNTLAYRLGRIAALTGLDPRRFEDAVQLRVAIHLHAPERE